jgi:DNA-binding MarR family transcriptional regulator
MLQCVVGQSTKALVHDITARTGCSVKTARRGIKQLEARGLIARRKAGRTVLNDLTPKAAKWHRRRFKPDLWLPPINGSSFDLEASSVNQVGNQT